MDSTRLADCWDHAADSARPFAFLVSTTGCAGDIRSHMGSADYSYAFVLKALAPALERLGRWTLVPVPESSLAYAAARAAGDGFRPIHLALHPLQNVHHTPAVPTVVFPFWEFPRIPDRDFGFDTRQNWPRMSRPADLILTACQFGADAFRRAGVGCPVVVMPVPLPRSHFDLAEWDADFEWTHTCRHFLWGGPNPSAGLAGDDAACGGERRGFKHRVKDALRRQYRSRIRPWLSPEGIKQVQRLKRGILRQPPPPPPLLPATELRLSGLVYTSIFNQSDRRKNARDLLSAFLLAFRDRPDVTLVLKLATSAAREFLEIQDLGHLYGEIAIEHACKVVVLTDFLTDEQMIELMRATTYYVNTSRAEGACLPLQQALAGGRPAIAPCHTAMADYMSDEVGFLVESHPEPTFWPHDPEHRFETTWHRLVWSNLRDQFIASALLIEDDYAAYRTMASAARERMCSYASVDVVAETLRAALNRLPRHQPGAFSWAA
jgi:glycosyltransferase involved in cell wall biosynthesis